MSRHFYVAAILLATAVLLAASLAVSAQMRGGGRGAAGGHSGGFAGRGGFSGHVGGGHAFGARSGPGFGTRGFNRGSSFHQPAFRGDRLHGDRFRDDRFRDRRFRSFGFRNCFGCRRWGGWPWGYAGYYDPYWWWDSPSSYDEDREREIRLANEMNAQSLQEQRMLHEEDQDLYARSDPRPSDALPAEAPAPATVLIFRDQHQQEVQNYAIVGSTLWAFGSPRTQKIPLSDLDIAATTKANDEHGVDFRIPGFGEGQ